MMNFLLHYIDTLSALNLFFLSTVCCCAPMAMRRRQFLPFALYAFFIGCGICCGFFLKHQPISYAGVELARFLLFWVGMLCLIDFSLVGRGSAAFARFFSLAGISVLCLTPFFVFGWGMEARVFSLCLLAIPAFLSSTVMLWKIGNRTPMNQLLFKSASIFHCGNFIVILLQLVFLLRMDRFNLISFQNAAGILLILSLFCSFACSICFLLILRDLHFRTRRDFLLTFFLPGLALLFFVFMAWRIPSGFYRYACRLEAGRAADNAEMLANDLKISASRVKQYADELAVSPWVQSLYASQKEIRSVSDRIGSLKDYANSVFYVIVYCLNTEGICIDSSNPFAGKCFAGSDFSFRDYFKHAMKDGKSCTIAHGVVTEVPCVFAARRIQDSSGKILGVVVARRNVGPLIRNLTGIYAAILTPEGKIMYSSRLPDDGHMWRRSRVWTPDFFASLIPSGSGTLVTAEADCPFFDRKGWKIAVGIETLLPFVSYALGQLFVILLWMILLCMYSIFIVGLRVRLRLAAGVDWREHIFHGNTAGILITDSMRNIVEANETFLRMLGYSLKELREGGIDIIYPNGRSDLTLASEAYYELRKNHSYTSTLTLRKKNGELILCRLSGRLLEKGSTSFESVIGGVIWSFTDLASPDRDGGHAEDYKLFFRKLLDQLPIRAALLDRNGFLLYCNDPEIASKMESSGVPLPFSVLCPSSAARMEEMLKNVLANGRPASFRHEMIRPDGLPVTVTDTLSPVIKNRTIQVIRYYSQEML